MSIVGRLAQSNESHIKWYALVLPTPTLRQSIYYFVRDSQIELLYILTPLAGIIEHSPLLFQIQETSSVIPYLDKDRVILFSADKSVSFTEVMRFLRARLYVRFEGQRRGFLHYYHPEVAGYLFGESLLRDTVDWLGPLCSVCFYRHFPWGDVGWYEQRGEGDDVAYHEEREEWFLRLSQQQALQLKQNDQVILSWLAQRGEDADQPTWLRLRQMQALMARFGINQQIEQDRLYRLALLMTKDDLAITYFIQHYQADCAVKREYIVEHVIQELR